MDERGLVTGDRTVAGPTDGEEGVRRGDGFLGVRRPAIGDKGADVGVVVEIGGEEVCMGEGGTDATRALVDSPAAANAEAPFMVPLALVEPGPLAAAVPDRVWTDGRGDRMLIDGAALATKVAGAAGAFVPFVG
jgi:hypothetical protein